MNPRRDPDVTLAAWLDEGPTDLPDATRRAIVTSLPTTPQARRGLLAPWRFPHMNTFARGAAVLVVAAVAIGALVFRSGLSGGVRAPSPSPVCHTAAGYNTSCANTVSTPPLPTLDATFVSPSHGYRISYPTGWTVTPGTGAWALGDTRYPGNAVSDAILTPSGTSRVRFSGASLALPSGMTMDDFRAFASPFSKPYNNDPCPSIAPLPEPLMINYETNPASSPEPVDAVVSINGCYAQAELGGYIYDVEVIAGGRGYTFTLDGHITTADAVAWLATITLEPASAPIASAAPSPSSSPSPSASK